MRKQITRFISGILTVIMLLSSVNVPVMADVPCPEGEHVAGEIIEAGTSWIDGDCRNGKENTVSCNTCHVHYTDIVDKQTEHDWGAKDGQCARPGCDGICTHTGHWNTTTGVCDECGYECPHPSYTDGKCDVCKINHIHGSEAIEYVEKTATHHTKQYKVCKKKETPVEHTWNDSTGKCSVCGYSCAHDWRAKDGKCGTCGFVCTSDTRVQGAVTWKDGDCTKGGVQDITCSTCGKTISANSPVTAKEKHTYSQGTCTVCGKADPNACQHPVEKLVWEDNNDGKTHKLSCGVESCKVVISANEIHTYPKGVCACGAIDPNCKHEGTTHMVATAKTHDYICDICGKVAKSEKHIFDKNAKCTVCGANPCGGKHTADYVSIASNKHQKYCTKCGFVIKTNIKCSWSIEKYDDKDDWDEDGHSVYCKACGNTEFKDHSFGYEYTDGDKHKKSCGCGVYYEQSCDYDSGKCKLCGHDKGGSSSSSSGSGAAYYAPTDLESLRKAGKALARDIITVKVNGASYDIAAVEAPLRDMANQYFIGNILLTQLGYNLLTPTKTYKLSSYNFYAAPNQSQTIVWKNTGLKAGDVAYVVYWNPTHKTQLLPCVVAADGSATFTVPDINGAICTLVKCEKVTPPAPAKKKK